MTHQARPSHNSSFWSGRLTPTMFFFHGFQFLVDHGPGHAPSKHNITWPPLKREMPRLSTAWWPQLCAACLRFFRPVFHTVGTQTPLDGAHQQQPATESARQTVGRGSVAQSIPKTRSHSYTRSHGSHTQPLWLISGQATPSFKQTWSYHMMPSFMHVTIPVTGYVGNVCGG